MSLPSMGEALGSNSWHQRKAKSSLEFSAEKDLRLIRASSLLFEAEASRGLPRLLSLKISPAAENGAATPCCQAFAGWICVF